MQTQGRFLKEIPEKFLKHKVSKPKSRLYDRYAESTTSVDPFPDYEMANSAEAGSAYRKGLRVYHPHFGPGIIHQVEGSGSKEKVSVQFDDRTIRKFLSQYANLQLQS